MKYIFLIALVVFSAQEVLMDWDPSIPCVAHSCSTEYVPVCGKQKVGDCWDVKIFNNSCAMAVANDCGAANYVPCVNFQCGAGDY